MTGKLAAGRPADTIFAPATGAGRAAVTVMRLSGPACAAVVAGLCGALPVPRRATLRRLRARDGELLDHAIVLWMPGPASYTGQDCAELHLHGGRAVLAAVTACLLEAGARPADPGEFSRRAFLAGKMTLLEAEAVADLVEAETRSQRLHALRQLQGAEAALVAGWADRLKRGLAFQEALIDFPDEDLPDSVEAALLEDLQGLLREVRAHLGLAERGRKLRDGLVFTIIGAPNVGKSSLLNALAGGEVAIVSPMPGTTRDVIEARLELGGIPVTLVDTAGLRETSDPVEAEGMARARARAGSADLVLHLVAPPFVAVDEMPGQLMIANKTDLAPAPAGILGVSVRTGDGLAALEALLTERARSLAYAGADPVFTRARHVAALRGAGAALASALAAPLPELRAEDLRLSVAALGRLTGAVDHDEILDVVFGAFCIGK